MCAKFEIIAWFIYSIRKIKHEKLNIFFTKNTSSHQIWNQAKSPGGFNPEADILHVWTNFTTCLPYQRSFGKEVHPKWKHMKGCKSCVIDYSMNFVSFLTPDMASKNDARHGIEVSLLRVSRCHAWRQKAYNLYAANHLPNFRL